MNRHRAFIAALPPNTYGDLLALQGGRCGVCRAEPKTRRLHIDHDHKAMRLRGLLCHRCNRRLDNGMDAAWLESAAEYLLYPPAGRLP